MIKNLGFKKSLGKISKVIHSKSEDIKTRMFFLKINNPITSLGSKIADIFEPSAHYGMNDADDSEWCLKHMNKNKESSEN